MELDAGGLEILHREECLALMGTVPIGRLVFTDRALPAILPVTFVLDGQAVIIVTAQGSKLAAAGGSVVAFEVDDVDTGARTGWSVTIVGRVDAVRDAADIERLSRLRLRTWAPGCPERFIRIRNYLISGRRVRPSAGHRTGVPATARLGGGRRVAADHLGRRVACGGRGNEGPVERGRGPCSEPPSKTS